MKSEIKFIKEVVSESKAKGIVVGLSGGIDSSVVACLSVKAVGKDNVFGLLLPTKFTPEEDNEDALEVAKTLGINYHVKRLDDIVESLRNIVAIHLNDISKGNMTARLRMLILYAFANQLNYLVAGTTDKSENFLGYFTKWGDGAVDFEPIIHLTKTEVRQLARDLRVPVRIVNKPSSPRLWKGHEAEKELGIKYSLLDKLLNLNKKTEHKRNTPRNLGDGNETVR